METISVPQDQVALIQKLLDNWKLPQKRAPARKTCEGCTHKDPNRLFCMLESASCVNSVNKPYYLSPEDVPDLLRL